MSDKLPEIKTKKKINIKEFVKLANKVKKIFEEEDKYFNEKNGNNPSPRFLTNY